MLQLLALLWIVIVSSLTFAQTADVQINVQNDLAPFKQYYESRAEWPRSHGWKPYMRYLYDVEQRAYPDGTIPAGARWRAWEEMQRMERVSLDEPWRALGPFNHGGRTRVLRFHPNNPNIMFAGSVGGGLYRSDNAGESWYPLTDALPNLAVGCFEISLSNPNIMFMGTGEGYFNGDAIKGIGLLKSVDGGVTWNLTSLNYTYSQGKSILKISIDPRNSNNVLASTNDGLYRSTNGGASFDLVRSGNINELKRDPQNPDVLLCAAGYPWGATQNGVYRSTDNGATWLPSSTGLPSSSITGRYVIDFFREYSLVVYCGVCGDFDYNGSQMIGVFRSLDNGVTWEQMSVPGEENHYASQGWYDMAIAVKPNDPEVVFNAGLDVYRSVNGGQNWSRRSWWHHSFGEPTFSHADHHELIFHPTDPNQLWDVNDGGIFVSYDNGQTWNEKNTGFDTYQYYAMGNATLDTALAYGGTQDNGTSRYDGDGDWDMVFGGDGGYCVVDYTNNNTIYVEYQNGNRYRSDDGGHNFSEINPGISGTGPWVTPIVQDPFAPNTIYTTTNGTGASVWMSPTQGRNGNWVNLGPVGSSNQVLAASPALPGRLYLGSSSSVFRYDTQDGQWINVSGNLPGTYTTRITPDPYDPNTVYVTKSGFSGGHVWKSVTSGTTWTDITGNLPNVPFQDVIVDLNDPAVLYAGGDIGVFRTENGGQSWHIFGDGLPAVRVDDMDMQTQSGVLRAATHGRGMWEIPTGSTTLAMLYPNGTELLAVGSTIQIRWSGTTFGGNVSLSLNRNYPSGAWETIVASTPNDGIHALIVSGPVTDHARFRITHLTQGDLSDTSNADSRIVNPALNLLSLNGGQTVLTGTNDTIRFERVLVEGSVSIELNRDYPSGNWQMLAENYSGADSYLWRVLQPGGERCRIRVTSDEQPWLNDMSETDFIMRAPQMTVLSPNGGEVVVVDQPYEITWGAAEYPGTFRVMLNRSYPDGNWELLTSVTENDGSWLWTPRGASTTRARIRLATPLDPLGTYVESAGDFTIEGGASVSDRPLPTAFQVGEVYPNPFNPSTQFTLDLPTRTHVTVRVTNQLGQTVATVLDAERDAGSHTIVFDGSGLSSGIYFLRVDAARETIVRKLTLLK
ncbi:T9SS type A sorting domain-containing protein [bacterium]|nr:T9SS type A sorting domain-containing protein [bacterium]